MKTLRRTGSGRWQRPARPREPVCNYRNSGLCIGVRRAGFVAWRLSGTELGGIGVPAPSEREFEKLLSRVNFG